MMANLAADMKAFLAVCSLDDVANNLIMLVFIMNQLIVSIDDFKQLSFKDDIKVMVKQFNTVAKAPRKCSFIQEKNIVALTFWYLIKQGGNRMST